MMQAAPSRVLIVTASDSNFMPLLKGMLASLAAYRVNSDVAIACFDLGLLAEDRACLEGQGVTIEVPRTHLGLDAGSHSAALRSFLARPFLREYFPGHEVYVWIDSDVWLQDAGVLDDYVAGARRAGMAITHERENSYRFQAWLLGWTTKHFLLGYGLARTVQLLLSPHLNAGFFAIHADAPHWDAWVQCYAAAIERTGKIVPHDQFALNQALLVPPRGQKRLDFCMLAPSHNWICDRGIPMWNDEAAMFCIPRPPFEPIGALHLAGPAKRTRYEIQRSGGGMFVTGLVMGATPEHPAALPL